MITGFNTDIKYEGVTYHVQTEDKGLNTPLILSLIYQGGTILASKRSPYEDLIGGKLFDEKVLAERLNRQHKLLCAAIKAGRIEDLKRMTMKESAEKRGLVAKKEIKPNVVEPNVLEAKPEVQKPENINPKVEKPKVEKPKATESKATEPKVENPTENSIPKPADVLVRDKPFRKQTYASELQNLIQTAKSKSEVPQKPKPSGGKQSLNKTSNSVHNFDNLIPIIEDVQIIEEPTIYDAVGESGEQMIILPPEAVEIVGDLSQFESLVGDELKIRFIGSDTFNSGDNMTVNILVCRGSGEVAVGDANVMIKVLGSSFRPMIYHSKTDNNGIAAVLLNIPTFKSGRAAILVRAIIKGEETEIRRVINPEV